MNQTTLQKMRSREMRGGTWMTVGAPVITELATQYNFDWLLLDLEHGYCSESDVLSNMQAVRNSGVALIVRVGQLEPAWIARILDWGAHGIMLPHVDTAAKAKACVEAMCYPPEGKRGFSSSARVYAFGQDEYSGEMAAPLFFAQIETQMAIDHVDAIAAVQGVDVLFVGPSDLRMDLNAGGKGQTGAFDAALEQVVRAAQAWGKIPGILARSPEDVHRYRQMGFTTIAYGSDLTVLKEGFHRAAQQLTDAAKPMP
jgi:2-dehydro-3-deoxyglucarate aldolase/4-hydroxy-2-oxoheptanedioate aldolase